MPPDIALSDDNFWDGWSPLSQYRTVQGWGHGPVQLTRPWLNGRPGNDHTRALCLQCDLWVGPERYGDPNSLRLVEDDAVAHLHQQGARCGVCEACLPDGALRHSWHTTVELLKANTGGTGD